MYDFYNYIRKPLDENEVKTYFLVNNIKKDVVKLINDFIYSLLDNIHSTYLGKEYINTLEEINNHFNWCFNKVIEDFKKEGFDFSKNQQISKYFYDYAIVSVYQRFEISDGVSKENDDIKYDELPIEDNWSNNTWNKVFTYNYKKTESDLDIMLDLCKMFDECIVRN